jgi:hypothetical protein
VWQTLPEEESEAETENGGGEDSWAEKELHRRLTRLLDGDEADRKRAAVILEAMRTGNLEHPNRATAPPP